MKNKCYLLLFELIQIAFNRQEVVSRTPSEEEWKTIFELSYKQGIIGISFCGLQKILEEQLVSIPQIVKYHWVALALQIKNKNELVDHRCREVTKILQKDGLKSVILKGQGVAALYPSDIYQYRQPGDIDVWVDGTMGQVIEYAIGIKPTNEFDEKHIHFDCFDDVPVELHWIPVKKWNPRWNRLLDQYFEKERVCQFSQSSDGTPFPTVDFQLTHQLLHVLSHFLSGGIGLRQMMDLYFAQEACIEQHPEKIPEVLSLFQKMGLMKFVAATQWVIKDVFCRESYSESQLIFSPSEKEGKALLKEIEAGGNFGQYNADNVRTNKTIFGRFWRKWTRLMKYDFLGGVVMPFARLKLEIWIKMERYRLKV